VLWRVRAARAAVGRPHGRYRRAGVWSRAPPDVLPAPTAAPEAAYPERARTDRGGKK